MDEENYKIYFEVIKAVNDIKDKERAKKNINTSPNRYVIKVWNRR